MNLDMALLCMQQARGRSAVDEEGRACLPRCWSTTCPERKWGTEDLVCFLITSSPPLRRQRHGSVLPGLPGCHLSFPGPLPHPRSTSQPGNWPTGRPLP